MRLSNRAAERFQHALDGERPADAEAESLLATSRMLSAVDTSRLAPREEFVHALRERLMAEAETMPALSPAAAQTAAARRAAARTTPVVLVMGRGLPRLLAGAAASVLAVGAVVGVASRSALPGSALYPVKGWLDSVAVQMAGSDYERGLTHLAQAQEHISDTRALSEQQGSEPGEFIEALDSAVASVRSGQRDLNTAFDGTGNPQALIAIRDFSARALPQVEALRPEVPAAALPALRELQALLEDSQTASVRRLAACAPSCALVSQPGAGPSQRRSSLDDGGPRWRHARSHPARRGRRAEHACDGEPGRRPSGRDRRHGRCDGGRGQRRRHALHGRCDAQRSVCDRVRPGAAARHGHAAVGQHQLQQCRGDGAHHPRWHLVARCRCAAAASEAALIRGTGPRRRPSAAA